MYGYKLNDKKGIKTMKIKATTRKTKQGYFQPVLIVEETKQRYTPRDMSFPSIDRKTAQKDANAFRIEALQIGKIPAMQ